MRNYRQHLFQLKKIHCKNYIVARLVCIFIQFSQNEKSVIQLSAIFSAHIMPGLSRGKNGAQCDSVEINRVAQNDLHTVINIDGGKMKRNFRSSNVSSFFFVKFLFASAVACLISVNIQNLLKCFWNLIECFHYTVINNSLYFCFLAIWTKENNLRITKEICAYNVNCKQ